MKAKTDAQRRREADARKREAGFVRVSVWVPAHQVETLKAVARSFTASAGKAS